MTTLKTAVFIPMPSAKVSTATAVKPGFRRSVRAEQRTSWVSRSIHDQRQTARVCSMTRDDITEFAQGGKLSIAGGHAPGDILPGFHFDVFLDVAVQIALHAAAEGHDRPSSGNGRRMPAMARANLSHLVVSTANCFLPFAVRR